MERQRVIDAQSDLAAAQKEAVDAKGNLAEPEEERKQLLIRETQALALQPAAPVHAAVVSEAEAWERTLGAITMRIHAPGVQPELANEVTQVLDTLRGLCGRLPAVVPVAEPVAAAPPAPAAPTADGTAPTARADNEAGGNPVVPPRPAADPTGVRWD